MNALNLSSIPKAYAAILFLQNPVAGLVIMAATLFFPNIGLAGILGAIAGFTVTRLWQFPDYAGQIQIFNSMLVGLSLGAFYQLNIYVVGIIVLSAILTAFLATVLADWLWRLDRSGPGILYADSSIYWQVFQCHWRHLLHAHPHRWPTAVSCNCFLLQVPRYAGHCWLCSGVHFFNSDNVWTTFEFYRVDQFQLYFSCYCPGWHIYHPRTCQSCVRNDRCFTHRITGNRYQKPVAGGRPASNGHFFCRDNTGHDYGHEKAYGATKTLPGTGTWLIGN